MPLDKIVDTAENFGPIATFFNFWQGRSTAFAIVFAIVGIILAFLGKLNGDYALFVTAIQGLVFCHSAKEDWVDYKQRQLQLQTTVVNNNIVVDKVVAKAVAEQGTAQAGGSSGASAL